MALLPFSYPNTFLPVTSAASASPLSPVQVSCILKWLYPFSITSPYATWNTYKKSVRHFKSLLKVHVSHEAMVQPSSPPSILKISQNMHHWNKRRVFCCLLQPPFFSSPVVVFLASNFKIVSSLKQGPVFLHSKVPLLIYFLACWHHFEAFTSLWHAVLFESKFTDKCGKYNRTCPATHAQQTASPNNPFEALERNLLWYGASVSYFLPPQSIKR